MTWDLDTSGGEYRFKIDEVEKAFIGEYWSNLGDTYFVRAGSNLQELLEHLVNTERAGGTIFLGEGTHEISWTASTVISEEIRIIGAAPNSTIIDFTADDADCFFDFNAACIIENVQFRGTGWSASGAPYIIRLGTSADRSVIRNCQFNEATIGTAVIYLSSASDVEISGCYFASGPVSDSKYLIYISAGSHRFRILNNYDPSCTTGYFVYVPNSSTETNDFEIKGNKIFGASGSYDACRIYLGGATSLGGNGGVNRGVVENNTLDITLSDPVTVLDIGGSNGSAYGDRGQVRVANNHFKCEYASSSKWTNNTFLTRFNLAKILFTDNHYYCRYIGYVSAAGTSGLLEVGRYAHDMEISDNHLGAWDCRNGIWIQNDSANSPYRLKIVDNTISALDHDGTGGGHGIYFENSGTHAGPQGFIIHGNIITASSSAEHTAVGSNRTTAGQRPNNGQIKNNNFDNLATIPTGEFESTVDIDGNKYF